MRSPRRHSCAMVGTPLDAAIIPAKAIAKIRRVIIGKIGAGLIIAGIEQALILCRRILSIVMLTIAMAGRFIDDGLIDHGFIDFGRAIAADTAKARA